MEAVLKKLNLSQGELREKYKQRAQTGDVVFKIGLVEIKAHSEVLAAQSLKYSAQFSGNWKNEKTIDFCLEISPEYLETFIGFFYFAASQPLNQENSFCMEAYNFLLLISDLHRWPL